MYRTASIYDMWLIELSSHTMLSRAVDVTTLYISLLQFRFLSVARSLFFLHMLPRLCTSTAISRAVHTMASQLPFTRLVQETQIGILSVLRACYL